MTFIVKVPYIPPKQVHNCEKPSKDILYEENAMGNGTIWQCDCGLEWIWKGGWWWRYEKKAIHYSNTS